MDTKEQIGKRIWHMRTKVLNKTQEEFAEMIDITPETVGNIERSVVFPSLHTVARIAERCGVTTDYLLGINSSVNK